MDKTERLLRMMEHPEQYSDEQLQELLSDEDCHELYETMRLSASAFEAEDAKEKIAKGIKAEEWQKFERKAGHTTKWVPFLLRRETIHQVAAAFICLLMLSGITYAAVQMVRQNKIGGELKSPTQEVRISNSYQQQTGTQPADSIVKPRIFENTPLDEVVSEIAHYYNKVAEIRDEQVHELRLYYKWEPKATLESVVADLNHFDRVNLIIEDNKLIVSP